MPPQPIPEGPDAGSLPAFIGHPATPHPVAAPDPPRHPFMAPNGRSNIHDDAYQTDTYQGPGPLGQRHARAPSTFLRGRVRVGHVRLARAGSSTVCVGRRGARCCVLLDPNTLDTLAVDAAAAAPAGRRQPRSPTSPAAATSTSTTTTARSIPTTTRHIYVVGETGGARLRARARLRPHRRGRRRATRSSRRCPTGPAGIWFASTSGRGRRPSTRRPARSSRSTLGEPIGNSFAVDETGGVFIVTDEALYRFDAAPTGAPTVTWRETYDNTGIAEARPDRGRLGHDADADGRAAYVAITDNADPMNVVVYKRARAVDGARLVCKQPVFAQGRERHRPVADRAPADSIVVENNYGYAGPAATEEGKTTTPGLERVDLDARQRLPHGLALATSVAPSVVPKLSLANGLVYTYTKDPRATTATDAWYLTALDFAHRQDGLQAPRRRGPRLQQQLRAGHARPDGTAYVGVLGGLVALRDKTPPPGCRAPSLGAEEAKLRRLRLHVRRLGRKRARVWLMGAGTQPVRRVDFLRGKTRLARDRKRPFVRKLVRVGPNGMFGCARGSCCGTAGT